jgi:two-component system response regulator YesN
MFKGRSTFNRLFISYILITLIPITLLFVLLYKNSVTNLRNEVESFTISNLSKIKETIDLRIRECTSIAALISINPKLSYYTMNGVQYTAVEGIEELGKYKAGNAFISDILVHYRNSADIFSSRGMSSIDVLVNRTLHLSELDKVDFYSQINNLDVPVLKSFASSGLMMYVVPLPLNGGVKSGSAIFVFHVKSIENMLSQGKTEFLGATYVVDAGNQTILTIHQNDRTADTSQIPAMLGAAKAGVHALDYNNESYSVIKTSSAETGWSYVTAMPKSQFLEKVNSQELFIIVSTIVIMLLCVTVALPLTLSNYRPIKKLHRLVNDYIPKPDKQGNADEMDRIHHAIDTTLSLNRTLINQLDDQRHLLKQNLLLRLLEGDSEYIEDWTGLLETSGLQLHGPYYTVMLVYYDPDDEEASQYNGRLMDWVAGDLSLRNVAYAVEIRSGNSIALVINLDGLSRRSELMQMADEMLAVYNESIMKRIRVGIGNAFDGMAQIRHSYIEAFAALEQRHTQPEQQVFFFDEALLSPESYWLSAEDQLHLLHSLKQGDRLMAYEVLDRILLAIELRQMPPSFNRFVCYKICDLVFKVIQDLPSISKVPFDAGLFNGTVGKAISFASLTDFKERIRTLIDGVCQTIAALNERRDSGLITHVLSYVREAYKEPGMSLESISTRFGYSNHYWSRFFKEKVNCHFTDYLWGLRLEEAKQQLMYTDKTIKDIVTDIGYIDITSFIRKFKSEEGITPGQFRKVYTSKGQLI